MQVLAPKHLGEYEVLARLAKGGMAELFLARPRDAADFDRLVAIKRILPELAADEHFARMFQEEARLAAQIDHPNVVRILESGQQGKTLFIVMELIQGPSVAAMINLARRDGRWIPFDVAAEIVAQACEGLHAAHELHDESGRPLALVHRDVSPGNLMVSGDGVVKLVDFGIAKAQDSAFRTRTGTVKGKYPYLSPEMCRAEPLDRRADIFALGASFHELLTLERLFERESIPQTMRAILEDPIPDPRAARPDVASSVVEVLMRALERDRARRFATAADLGHALREALDRYGARTSPGLLADHLARRCAPLLDRRARAIAQVAERTVAEPGGPVFSVRGFDDGRREDEPPGTPATPSRAAATAPTRRRASPRLRLALIMAATFVVALAGTFGLRRILRPPPTTPPLRLGLIPVFQRRQATAELAPLLGYLERRVGRPVRIVADLDYERLRRALVRGELDLAFLPHLQLVLAEREDPRPRIVAATTYRGKPTYRSVIVVRDNSGIRTLVDLKGKRFCWNEPGSASGYLMPRMLLRSEGLDPDRIFATSQFSGSHARALKSVIEGRCDATATNEGWLVIGTRQGLATARLRVLADAGAIPMDMVCASPRLPAALFDEIRRALLELDIRRDLGRDVLGPSFLVDGFGPPAMDTYAPFMRAIRQEGILPPGGATPSP